VSVHAKKLIGEGGSLFDSVQAAAVLTGGALEVKPLRLGLAGGQALGALTFDARQDPPQARVELEIRYLRLSNLFPPLAEAIGGAAPVRGHVKLAGRGDSLASLIGSASGSIAARMDKGRISNLADAKLALDMGRALKLLLRGDRHITLNCGVVEADVRNGTATSRTIVLDTEETHTSGIGTLDLRDQRWQVVLTPQPRRPGLFTRDASIRLHGSFTTARVALQERLAMRRVRGGPGKSEERGCDGAVKAAPQQRSAR
jgi:uncharacterized protein involved in outer membrane biogenesis